jgi:hypothetical protein
MRIEMNTGLHPNLSLAKKAARFLEHASSRKQMRRTSYQKLCRKLRSCREFAPAFVSAGSWWPASQELRVHPLLAATKTLLEGSAYERWCHNHAPIILTSTDCQNHIIPIRWCARLMSLLKVNIVCSTDDPRLENLLSPSYRYPSFRRRC